MLVEALRNNVRAERIVEIHAVRKHNKSLEKAVFAALDGYFDGRSSKDLQMTTASKKSIMM